MAVNWLVRTWHSLIYMHTGVKWFLCIMAFNSFRGICWLKHFLRLLGQIHLPKYGFYTLWTICDWVDHLNMDHVLCKWLWYLYSLHGNMIDLYIWISRINYLYEVDYDPSIWGLGLSILKWFGGCTMWTTAGIKHLVGIRGMAWFYVCGEWTAFNINGLETLIWIWGMNNSYDYGDCPIRMTGGV